MINTWSREVNKTLLGLVLAITLAGCDTVEDMRDMMDARYQLEGIIKEELGIESRVGFNMNNGVLIDVSISLNAKDAAGKCVPELEKIAQSAVEKSFDSKPRAIYIQIVTTAE